ncbi:MAG: MFS transporter [Sulfolobales archaeon]|nr:MFS transporter [Sulfolobales archaeon]
MITYILIFINSIITSAINLAISLKAFEITSSVYYVSLTVLLYNSAYIIMSWTWTKIAPSKDAPKKLLFAIFVGYLASSSVLGLSNAIYLVLICSVVIGLSSAVSSPLLMSVLGNQIGKDYLTVSRYNLISSVASVIGYLLGWLFDNTKILFLSLAVISAPATITLRYLNVMTLIEFKKELHISTTPMVTGRVKDAFTVTHSHTLLYDFRILVEDFFKTIKKGVLREFQLLIFGTVVLFTAISTFFTPFPAYLKSNKLSDGDIFVMNLVSSTTSILGFRAASRVVNSIHKAWSILKLCVGLRVFIFLIPIISFTYIQELSVVKIFLIAFYMLIGFTWSFISSSLTTLVLSISERNRKGERLGHMNGAIGIGSILGSLISVYIGEYGFLIGYPFVGVLLIISAAILHKASKTLVT